MTNVTKIGRDIHSKERNWFRKHKITFIELGCMTFVMVLLCFVDVSAISTTVSNDKLGLQNVVDLVLGIVTTIGIIVAIFGAGMTGLGFAQDNPDSQSRGIKTLAGGVIAAGASVLIKWLKLSS